MPGQQAPQSQRVFDPADAQEKDWIGMGFRILFLFGMWSGYSKLRKLKKIDKASITHTVLPAETMR